jgi:hypothetical protein
MDERQPVKEEEFVYRRIHRNYYQVGLLLPIQPEAFRPTRNDTSGISIFRATFVQPEEILADIDTTKRLDYHVTRLAVRDLSHLGLTVVPDPDLTGPAGHAIVPELSTSAYQADKRRLKGIQLELAKLASVDIVYSPS